MRKCIRKHVRMCQLGILITMIGMIGTGLVSNVHAEVPTSGQESYDENGYDENGYDENGYDANGYDANSIKLTTDIVVVKPILRNETSLPNYIEVWPTYKDCVTVTVTGRYSGKKQTITIHALPPRAHVASAQSNGVNLFY